MMRKERGSYDPKSYGELKAKFLDNVAGLIQNPDYIQEQSPHDIREQERLKLIKDIREGRLRPTEPPTKREAEG